MKLWQPVFAAAALLAGSSAWAETATGNFKTTIEITKACMVNTHTGSSHEAAAGADIDFGRHPASHSQPVTANSKVSQGSAGALTVECSQGTSFTIGLKPASSSKNDGTGEMIHTGGTHRIAYSLYKDAGHNEPWGNEGNLVSKSGQGFNRAASSENTFTVFGKVEATQLDKPAGRYNDTVQVTVTY